MKGGQSTRETTGREGGGSAHAQVGDLYPEAPPKGATGRFKAFMSRHGRKLWWLHSVYAMGLGAFVVIFAQKGFRHARWLTLSLVVAWLITLVLFRAVGSGQAQALDTPKARLRFLLITYVLKNLYQGMLFFLLPFYWKTAVVSAANRWFVVLLGLCTLLATLDLVFDRVLMRWRSVAATYFGVTLFAVLNLAIPALFPLPAVYSLVIAAGVATVAFWTLHLPMSLIRQPRMLALMGLTVGLASGGAWWGRTLVPPVPLTVVHAAVGPEVLPDGRLALEVTSLHASHMKAMKAVTDVQTPAGVGEAFVHVWWQDEVPIRRIEVEAQDLGPKGRVRLMSDLKGTALPELRAGQWRVDVETAHGQLVGRVAFTVTE